MFPYSDGLNKHAKLSSENYFRCYMWEHINYSRNVKINLFVDKLFLFFSNEQRFDINIYVTFIRDLSDYFHVSIFKATRKLNVFIRVLISKRTGSVRFHIICKLISFRVIKDDTFLLITVIREINKSVCRTHELQRTSTFGLLKAFTNTDCTIRYWLCNVHIFFFFHDVHTDGWYRKWNCW